MYLWKYSFLFVTSFLNVFALRTFSWNPQQTVKSLPCYHHVPILNETGGLPQQLTPLLSYSNFSPVKLFPRGFLVLAALISGFANFPTSAVADAFASSPSALIIGQMHVSPLLNQRKVYHWTFANGDVTLPDEIFVAGMTLVHPRLLGSGAGGAVFALQQKSLFHFARDGDVGHLQEIALKVSWKGSSQDVKRECDLLKKLQRSSSNRDGRIGAVEVCLGEGIYRPDPTRTVIALQPVFHDEQVASVVDLLPDQHKVHTAVALIIRTMLQMLSANVVTMDVQPLISKETGEVFFIDFTQAISILFEENDKSKATDMEAVVIRNFVNEMMQLIPKEQQERIASKLIVEELSNYPKQLPSVYDVLMEQSFSHEALEYLSQQIVERSALMHSGVTSDFLLHNIPVKRYRF
jgi:hypothetical protein